MGCRQLCSLATVPLLTVGNLVLPLWLCPLSRAQAAQWAEFFPRGRQLSGPPRWASCPPWRFLIKRNGFRTFVTGKSALAGCGGSWNPINSSQIYNRCLQNQDKSSGTEDWFIQEGTYGEKWLSANNIHLKRCPLSSGSLTRCLRISVKDTV